MYSKRIYPKEVSNYLIAIDGASIHEKLLRMTYYLSAPHYTCLRPPGAAGALLVSTYAPYLLPVERNAYLGCVEPPVGPTCKELGACDIEDGHCVRAIHAEVNAILLAYGLEVNVSDAVLYSILKPCYQCSKVIVAAGIKEIYYAGRAYDEERTRELLSRAGVECKHIDIGLGYGNG